MPRRIAVFLPDASGGGAERSLLTLAGAFAERGHAVDLVLARATGDLLGEVPETVRLVDLGARRVLLSVRGLVRYLRAERPHAMLSAPKHANVVALAARKLARVDTRLVVSERNALSTASANDPRRVARLLPALMRRTYPWADGVIAVSRGVADDLCRTIGLPRDRVSVIYNPAVTPNLLARMNEPVEQPWFAPGAPPVILSVGRLTPQKDFPTLIQAFAALRARRPARLMILGEGAERARLEALVADHGLADDVSLPGFAANPYAYMRQAAVFALSSRWEGFGVALAEALACGMRVVSTDCPSGPAEILEGGRWGRLVPVGDADRLARAIEAALDDTPDPGVTRRLEAFTVGTATDAYLDLLLGPANGGCRAPHPGHEASSPAAPPPGDPAAPRPDAGQAPRPCPPT